MSWDLDGMPGSLLTLGGNPKLDKGRKAGYWTAGLMLSPNVGSGVMNTCSYASAGCAAACLNFAGHGGMGLDEDRINTVQEARIKRTRLFKRNPSMFKAILLDEIATHVRRCERNDVTAVIRLNTVSDLPWENIKMMHGENIFELFPEVQFYDYTKYPVSKRLKALRYDNYHLTFSLSEENDRDAQDALYSGLNVAVVMDVARSKPLPETWGFGGKTYPVIDGDLTDLRFLDSIRGGIVGLRAKGSLKMRKEGREAGFVRAT